MMIANNDAYKKSILFELVNRNTPGADAVEAFTLTVPPENFEIDEPQRLSQTKTFGGIFLDDYGPEVLHITISGTTGSADVRHTYTKNGTSDVYNGKTSFYYFRDHLMRYKNKLDNYADYDMNIYDLSPADESLTQGRPYATDLPPMSVERTLSDGYVCALLSFKMVRSKDRPLWYNYSIELVGLRPLGVVQPSVAPYTASKPDNILANITALTDSLDSFFASFSFVTDKTASVIDLAGKFSQQFQAYVTQTQSVISYPMNLAGQVFQAARAARDAIFSLTTLQLASAGIGQHELNNDYVMLGALVRNAADLVAYGKTPQATGSETMLLSASATGVQQASSAISSATSQSSADIAQSMITSNMIPVTVYGHTLEKIDDSTTLEALALKYYGDLSYVELLAIYNNVVNDAALHALGNWIKIPILAQLALNPNNQVFSDNVTDVYGADIALDAAGRMLVSGDFGLIRGQQNVIQAMNLRLSTRLGARWRLVLYGIRAAIGSAGSNSAPLSYMISNIRDTILQDPRVKNVDSLTARIYADKLYIGFNLELIQQSGVIPYMGVV
jgi:hypothetical protein